MKINARTALLVLAAAATLTACGPADDAPRSASTTASPTPNTLPLELPVTPPAPELTGTDAGLITEPAPGPVEATASPARPARPIDRAPVPATVPAVPAPAPPVEPVLPVLPGPPMDGNGPTDDSDCFREDIECYGEPVADPVQDQLPEEVIGGYRCGDDVHVVVRIDEDGTLICGLSSEIGQ